MKINTCKKHGRVMLHNGKCHDCRNEEVKENINIASGKMQQGKSGAFTTSLEDYNSQLEK